MKFMALACALAITTPALAADLERAIALYNAKEYDKAFPELKTLAEQGNARAQSYLGTMYAFGYGVAKDDREAFRWDKAAAEQGDVTGMKDLAMDYRDGVGVEKDYQQAAKWFKACAEKKGDQCFYNLGALYYNAQGFKQDFAMAERYWKAEVELTNSKSALYWLGYMNEFGMGKEKNIPKAVRYYQAAALQDDPKAYCALAEIYTNGAGVGQDIPKAIGYYRQAIEKAAVETDKQLYEGKLKKLVDVYGVDGKSGGRASGAAPASAQASGSDSCQKIAGNWKWFTGGIVIIHADNKVGWKATPNATSAIPGTWQCDQKGAYTLSWSNGFVDSLTLSGDGNSLSGANAQGVKVTATRQ